MQGIDSGAPNVEVQMSEIDVVEQIGRGGYGAVYKGSWRGAQVAVKYIICDVGDADAVNQSVREVVLSKKMSLPVGARKSWANVSLLLLHSEELSWYLP